MTHLYVLLQFDHKIEDRIIDEHKNRVIARRLWTMGLALSAGLGMLAVVFGYLKITGKRVKGARARG